ncbi:MAG: DUF5906 domain-containing protein [Pseudomonadota bacterium]
MSNVGSNHPGKALSPIPASAPNTTFRHRRYGEPSHVATYRSLDGQLLGYTARFDWVSEEGKTQKAVLPRTYCIDANGGPSWQWKGFAKPYPLYRQEQLLDRPEAPVLLVEGERCAEAAQEHFPDHVALSWLGGCKAVDQVDWRPLGGRRVVLWPDNDPPGQKAMKKIAAHLQEIGCPDVRLVQVPEGLPPTWDLADCLPHEFQRQNLRDLLESTVPIATDPQPSTDDGNTFFDDLSIGSNLEMAKCLLGFLKSKYGIIRYSEGDFWRYGGSHWQKIIPIHLMQFIHNFDGAQFPAGRKQVGTIRLTHGRVDDTLKLAASRVTEDAFFANPARGINCQSGFIEFDTEGNPSLIPHSPDHKARHVLPGAWPAEISQQYRERSSLRTLLYGCFGEDEDAADKIRLIQELAGAIVLGQSTKLIAPLAVILYGPIAENGKSQILDMFRGLVPPEACANIPPNKFADKHYLCALPGVLLNTSDELTSASAIMSDVFKSVITGDPVTARDLYKSTISFRAQALHVFASNTLPPFKGGFDKGVKRRLCVIPFNRQIPKDERIDKIGAKIAEQEPDLLLDFALQGATRVVQQGHYSLPLSCEEALRDWALTADSLEAWAAQGQVIDGDKPPRMLTRQAHSHYQNWATAQGYRQDNTLAIGMFSQRLPVALPGVKIIHPNNKSTVVGLKLPEDGDD